MKPFPSWTAVAVMLAILTVLMGAGVVAEPAASLTLETTIPLPDVSGRIDHMALDRGRQRLIVAALGNDTVEVIDLRAGKRLNRIGGLAGPQGVAHSDKADLIFVANAGDGSVRMFRGADLAPVGRIDLRDDADNIRVDPRGGNLVIGYGKALAIIDPMSRAVIGTIPLPGHPEGFQIEPATGRVFVNVPDARQITVVDLDARRQVATWKIPGAANFPMMLFPGRNMLATVFRTPPRLALIDTNAGAVLAAPPACGDADDVFFDARRDRVYVSCGEGFVDVLERRGSGYERVAQAPTVSGARTSLFLPEADRLFVAARASGGKPAAILVFRPMP